MERIIAIKVTGCKCLREHNVVHVYGEMMLWFITLIVKEEIYMRLYDKPVTAYLHNDLVAFESEENDKHLIYFFEKGYVTVLGEFESDKYVGGTACIIFNLDDVISVDKGMLRFVDEKGS